jgi:hypothetical protein
MLIHAYLRNGIVYVPTVAVREGGPVYTDVEPVAVVAAADSEGLRRALLDAFARGNAKVPRPAGTWPDPVLLKHAGVKTWSAFARTAALWSIEEEDGIYQIVGYRKRQGGSWEQDAHQKIRFPPGAAIEAVVDCVVAVLQEAARRGAPR